MTTLLQGPRSVCVSGVYWYVLLHMYCVKCVLQKAEKIKINKNF